jgi:thiamine kinase-like enzyme
MIRIENRKTYRGEGVYIGRPALLGNPFKIGEDGTREQVIARYRERLWEQIKQQGDVYRELKRLAEQARQDELVLVCWCKERGRAVGCHGDVVSAAILWINSAR